MRCNTCVFCSSTQPLQPPSLAVRGTARVAPASSCAPLSQQAARQRTQQENRATATASNPTLRACLLCLLRLAAAAAGRRGVARQVWRVLQSKVAVWREQWGACLPNNRLASHELHSSPSAHHTLNRPITSGSKAIKQGRKWFAAAAAGALCGSFPRARTRAALSRQIALIYLCNRVLGEMRLKAKRGQSSSAQSPQCCGGACMPLRGGEAVPSDGLCSVLRNT